MTSKNKLSENHTRSLSVTSKLIEKSINEIEAILKQDYKNNFAEIIKPVYSNEEREKFFELLNELKEANKKMFLSLKLKPNRLTEDRVMFAQLSYLWTILLDSKSEKLHRYGDLAEQDGEIVDEHIDKLLAIIEKLKKFT